MADMSKAEKRAVALKKLKEFQQQKTSTNTFKGAKKKQGCPTQTGKSNGSEQYSFFTGFSDSTKNEIETHNGTSTSQENMSQPYCDRNLCDERNNQNNSDNVQEMEESSVPQNDSDRANSEQSEENGMKDLFMDQTSLPSADGDLTLNETYPPSTQNLNLERPSSSPDSSNVEMKTGLPEKLCNEDIPGSRSIPSTVEDINKRSLMSSTESLRQLSLEMNGLVEEPVFAAEQAKTDVHHKHQELVELLAREQHKSENLQLQLKEHQVCAVQLRAQLAQQRLELEARQQRELAVLQEQLQLHTQTLGILVAEKTELEAALDSSQRDAGQKAELEEAQGRLRAARQRSAELERAASAAAGSSRQLEGAAAEQGREVARLRLEKQALAQQLREAEEEAAELRSGLGARGAELLQLQAQVLEQRAQLDRAQLRVQQLSLADAPDAEQQLAAAQQQHLALQLQVSELQQAVRSVGQERDQANAQYQEYLQHVSGQLTAMADKMAATTAENERLCQREQSLVQHLSELERQLQTQRAQREQEQEREQQREDEGSAAQRERVQVLEEQLSGAQTEAHVLAQQLDGSREQAQALQAQLEALQADRPDADRLLAAMESDKVAAARAVGQNLQLKRQLEELQEAFVEMSNSKLERTEQLQREQHLSKELGERLAQQEMEIGELRLQLQQSQQEAREQEARHSLQQSQLADQVRHYEAQGHVVEMLRSQLQQAKEESKARGSDSEPATVSDAGTETNEEAIRRQDFDEKKYIDMQEAMEKLQARFTTTMAEVAELSDEKHRLEHLVLQLQEETETIGEYIALYQVQRSILRQRAQEKDEQLARLARDREEVKTKLSELNHLINQLVTEKGSLILPGVERTVSETCVSEASDGLVNGDVSTTQFPTKTSAETEGSRTLESAIDNKEQSLASNKVDTAGKIIALLSEIETSTLVEPRNNENFHPCPWCSGRLITV